MHTIDKIRNMMQGAAEMRAHSEFRKAAHNVGFGKPTHATLTMEQLKQNSKDRQEEQ